jgi:hypothetical protein
MMSTGTPERGVNKRTSLRKVFIVAMGTDRVRMRDINPFCLLPSACRSGYQDER